MSDEIKNLPWTDVENMFNNLRSAIHAIQGDSLGKQTLIDQIIVAQCEGMKHQATALQRALEAKHER